MTKHTSPGGELIAAVRAYLLKYTVLVEPEAYTLALSLWLLGTNLWPDFDAFAYLQITSDTKRSGKTRLAELLAFMAANSRSVASATPATIFHMIRDEQATLFVDEAETLKSEAASTIRELLNVGYRKGQTVPRMDKGTVQHWPTYCPKCFILIGDAFDTLRDRSIIVRMKRAPEGPPVRFVRSIGEVEGMALGMQLGALAAEYKGAILAAYTSHPGLSFLSDRDEEIWLPLFAMCQVVAPELLTDLTRTAADMAVEKTSETRSYVELKESGAEERAEAEEYGLRLLRDLGAIMHERCGKGKRHAIGLFTADALQALHELPTGPWRKFRGAGLTDREMALLLKAVGVYPAPIRSGGGRKDSKVARGYKWADVKTALSRVTDVEAALKQR